MGIVELGTGADAFEPIEDGEALTLVAGPQGGYHFELRARIQALQPGELSGPREENPQTLFSAYLGDEALDIHECPFRLPYLSSGDFSELSEVVALIIRSDAVPRVSDERVRLVVEVVDAKRRYAIDERSILVKEAPEPDAGVE